ncbi:MAG: hypothetical protein ACI8R4_003808 [Paracoccaceae bacterium]|jgi:hypothetical protein
MQTVLQSLAYGANTGGICDNSVKNSQCLPQFQRIETPGSQYAQPNPSTEKGTGTLLAYLLISLFTGFTCALVSLLGFDGGVWMALVWYVFGSWIGFALAVIAYMATLAASENGVDQSRPEYP